MCLRTICLIVYILFFRRSKDTNSTTFAQGFRFNATAHLRSFVIFRFFIFFFRFYYFIFREIGASYRSYTHHVAVHNAGAVTVREPRRVGVLCVALEELNEPPCH